MPDIVYKPNFTKEIMSLPAGALKLFFYLVDKAKNNLIDLKKFDRDEFENVTGFSEKTFYNNITILISNQFLTRGNAIEFVFLNPDIVEVGSLDQIIRNKLLIEKYPHKLCPQCKPPNANTQLSKSIIQQEAIKLWSEVGATHRQAGLLLRYFILFLTHNGGYFADEYTLHMYQEELRKSKESIPVDEAKDNFDIKKTIEALEDQLTLLEEDYGFYKNLSESILLNHNKATITKEYNVWKITRSKVKELHKYLDQTNMRGYSYIEKIRDIVDDIFNSQFDEEDCDLYINIYGLLDKYRSGYLNEKYRFELHLSNNDVKLLRDIVEQIEEWDDYLLDNYPIMYC